MGRASFRFYEELNDFLPPARRKRDLPLEFDDAAPLRHWIESFGVPHTEIEIVLVNGESVDLERVLRDGDRVSVYPAFEALDVTPLLRLRPRPLREPRFLADAHLGRLAGYLRMLGFDTRFRNDWSDAELVREAAAEHRTVLTRDRALLMRRGVTHGCYVHEVKPARQLVALIERLDLCRRLRPFTRCIRCNEPLETLPEGAIPATVPPGARRRHARFFRCRGCGQVYWKGSHYARMRARIRDACPGWSDAAPAGAEGGVRPAPGER